METGKSAHSAVFNKVKFDYPEYEEVDWPETLEFTRELNSQLSRLDWPAAIETVVCKSGPHQSFAAARRYLEVIVSFRNGGLRKFLALTYECVVSFYKSIDQTENKRSKLDFIRVDGIPIFIVIEVEALAIYNGVFKYLMFERELFEDPKYRLAQACDLSELLDVDLSRYKDLHRF